MGADNGERKTVPSFAGNINIGVIDTQKDRFNSQQRPGPAARPSTTSPPRNFNNFQNQNFRQQPRQQTRPQQFPQQQQRQQQQFQQQQPQRQPQQQFQQQQPQRQPATPAPTRQLSLFEQIKQRINREKQLKKQIVDKQIEKERQEQTVRQQQQPQPQQTFRQPQPQQTFRQPQPQQNFQQNLGSFGVFEAVDLSGPVPSPLPRPTPARNLGSRQAQNEGFFGVFPEVNLQ